MKSFPIAEIMRAAHEHMHDEKLTSAPMNFKSFIIGTQLNQTFQILAKTSSRGPALASMTIIQWQLLRLHICGLHACNAHRNRASAWVPNAIADAAAAYDPWNRNRLVVGRPSYSLFVKTAY